MTEEFIFLWFIFLVVYFYCDIQRIKEEKKKNFFNLFYITFVFIINAYHSSWDRKTIKQIYQKLKKYIIGSSVDPAV